MLLKCTGRRSTLNWLFRGRSIAGTQSVRSGTGSLLRLRRKPPTGFYIDISHRKNISTGPRPRSLSVLPTGRSCTAGPAKKRTRKKKRASRISLRTRLTAPTSRHLHCNFQLAIRRSQLQLPPLTSCRFPRFHRTRKLFCCFGDPFGHRFGLYGPWGSQMDTHRAGTAKHPYSNT